VIREEDVLGGNVDRLEVEVAGRQARAVDVAAGLYADDGSGRGHVASLFAAASLSRFRLALDRQVAEQNRSRFMPQVAAPQVSHLPSFAAIGFWQQGQGFIGTENCTIFVRRQAVSRSWVR